MRIILLYICLLPSLAMGQVEKKKAFQLTGVVNDVQEAVDGIIYLSFQQDTTRMLDSARIVDGRYTFKGTLQYPVLASLKFKVASSVDAEYEGRRMLKDYERFFYIDAGDINLVSSSSLRLSSVSGSVPEADKVAVDSLSKPYYNTFNDLYKKEGQPAYQAKDAAAIQRYELKREKIFFGIDALNKSFIVENPSSGLAFDLLREYCRIKLDPVEIEPMFTALSAAVRNSKEGKLFAKRIANAKKTAVGTMAPEVRLKDKDGADVLLSSLKGKYVLVDFWGSWCQPCRASHPHLKTLYDAHKNKGFEIYGISTERGSLDAQRSKWIKAMEEDGMDWVNVLLDEDDGKDYLTDFSIEAFPTKILIDRSGMVIAKFVGGSQTNIELLDQKIASIFN